MPHRSSRFAAFFLVALAAASCSCGRDPTTGQSASFRISLEADPSGEADHLLDFGVVALGERRAETVVVGNGGNAALVVASGKLSKPFSHDIPPDSLSIPVGGEARLRFAFEPEEETAEPREAIVELFTNEDGGRLRTVRLKGQGKRASLECEPATLDFGTVQKGASRSLATRCRNLLPIPVDVEAQRLLGANADAFSAALGEEDLARIPAGGALDVEVRFQAVALGANEATLSLATPSNQLLASIPLAARVVAGALAVEPEGCLDFSYVPIGGSADGAFALRTVSGSPLRIMEISIPEASRSEFSIVSEAPIVLPASGASEALRLRFHPTVGGPRQIPIELVTDDPREEGRRVIACAKGFGGGPSIACSPDRIDFGMVAVGMPARRSVSCVNTAPIDAAHPIDPLIVEGFDLESGAFSARILDEGGREGPRSGGYAAGEGFRVEVDFDPVTESFDDATLRIVAPGAGGKGEVALSGQGRDLPPCEFTIEPPLLRFGVVAPGVERSLAFGIRNHLETSCLIRELRLAAGSDASFSMEPIDFHELPGHGNLEVRVEFAPRVEGRLVEGRVEFEISNPERSRQEVRLSGIAQEPCIRFEPEVIDFGKVAPGCATRELWVAATNHCARPVTLSSVEIAAHGDPDAFRIRQRPILPRTLSVNERREFTLVFQPESEGRFGGSLVAEVEGSEPYVTALAGEGIRNPVQTDHFDATGPQKVDILWVIDNSGSFDIYQRRIAENLPAFLTAAEKKRIDFHIAVTTSGIGPAMDCPGGAEGGEDGRFFPVDGSHPRILNRMTPDLERHWAHNVSVGTCHAWEYYIEAAFRALSKPLIDETKDSRYAGRSPYDDGNAGFLRREAFLSVIFVADEPDQSTSYGKTLDDYLAFFISLKGSPTLFRAHGITGGTATKPSCIRDSDRIHQLIDRTGGTWLDICTPTDDTQAWTEGLTKMSEGAFGFLDRFILRGPPADSNGDGRVDEEDIQLFVDGAANPPWTPARQRRWTFDPMTYAIDFTPLHAPKEGSRLSATYRVGCGGTP